MRLHLHKKAIRCFGIAESFRKGALPNSILAGVVMRSDFIIDGFSFGRATLGGNDATNAIVLMFKGLHRKDVNFLMVGGSIVSLFNIIDVDGLYSTISIPVISITYHPSEGLEDHLKHHFPFDQGKVEAYKRLGDRECITLHTGKQVFIRCAGIGKDEAKEAVDRFTLQGGVPEPIKVAKLISRAMLNYLSNGSTLGSPDHT
ncbi:MAG: DUF99 family protein [Nitrososphaeria archaeon]